MPFAVRAFGGIALFVVILAFHGVINSVLRTGLDIVLAPFAGLHPLVGLTILAVPFSIVALIMFRETSDQDRLAEIKDHIFAGLFEIRLFNDDLRAVFRAQGEILSANMKYFGNAMIPLLWILGPFALLTIQLHYHYAYEGLRPGDETLVRVQLADGWRDAGLPATGNPGRPQVSLEAPDGLKVETPAVWASAANEVVWRVAAEKDGRYELGVKAGDRTYTKSVVVSERRARRAPARVAGGMLNFDDLDPTKAAAGEATLPADGPIRSIAVDYPEAGITLDLANWVWAFFGLTLVIGFALKDRFGVTI